MLRSCWGNILPYISTIVYIYYTILGKFKHLTQLKGIFREWLVFKTFINQYYLKTLWNIRHGHCKRIFTVSSYESAFWKWLCYAVVEEIFYCTFRQLYTFITPFWVNSNILHNLREFYKSDRFLKHLSIIINPSLLYFATKH